jgi:outer membrane receptor protein involved in Fe transport
VKPSFRFLVCVALLWCGGASAAPAIETVVVTASALPGATIDPDTIAATVETFSSEDLRRLGSANLLRALGDSGAGVSLSEAQDNPFQPNLFYRGFEASPLSGDAQGLAVYLDGVRLNQPFGDAVNWDLVPDLAVSGATVESSNPVFGLNALGGSVSLSMKNGFSWQGTEAEILGGAFGRAEASVQFGRESGDSSLYIAATGANDDGWRDHSPSRLVRGFADFGWRVGEAELHLDLLAADTNLTGNGPSPVELLAVDRSAVFTFPDNTRNRYGLANLFGTVQWNAALSLQANLYVSRFRQDTSNGDASDAEPCNAGLLCLDDGTVLTDVNGNPIPDFLSGGPYAQLNATQTKTFAFGGAAQLAWKAQAFGRDNQLVAGAAFDGGRTDFSAGSELGALTRARGFEGPGILIDLVNGEIAPASLASDNDYFGLYAADVLNLSEALSLSMSARFNAARIALHDRLGTALNGSHRFLHLNPAAGLTYKLSPEATLYGGVSVANRAPTPAEFSCADPNAPCSLTNFFVADPPLKQVVAHTVEAGLRGRTERGELTVKWQLDAYRTNSDDDILFAASPVIGRGFFRNIGTTRRQGADLSLDLAQGPWIASLSYSLVDATFRSALTLSSPDNPQADANGEIHVVPGDRLPSIPRNTVKLGLGYRSETLAIDLAGRYADGQYLRGDESNLNPKTGPYFVLDASASYRFSNGVEFFTGIENLLDAKYESFGTFSPTADVPIFEVPNASNPRSLSPGAPVSAFLGLRVSL